jgi:hypothetical protein
MSKSKSTSVLYTTQYYRDHRVKESKRRLENYYKNRHGIEPEQIEEFKQTHKKLESDRKKLNRALKLIKDIPNACQYILSNIANNENENIAQSKVC